jgi:transglutaminase-like putative cysteine protease
MRVKLSDETNKREILVPGEIYLHGAVLISYEKGFWKSDSENEGEEEFPHWKENRDLQPDELEPLKNPPKTGVTRQTITIEPMESSELFCIRPFFISYPNPSIQIIRKGERLFRTYDFIKRRFTFFLHTTAIADGKQKPFVFVKSPPNIKPLLQFPSANSPNGKDNAKGLPHLRALADKWMADSKLSPEDWNSRARMLKRRMDTDDRFEYSLQGQERDWEIDPIEDFVTNNPKGHCEYFATALTMMLRSQGIPARLVVGYKCDEFNQLGGFYQVRQLHAHTWVEVFLPRDKLPPPMQNDTSVAGAWMRLDPTPSGSGMSNTISSWLTPIAGTLDWLEFAWENYVMEMDRARQQEAVYKPFVSWLKNTLEFLTDPNWWKSFGKNVLAALNPNNWNVSEWFSWRGGLVGSAICLALVFLYRGCRYLWQAIRRRLDAGRTRRQRAARVEVQFYRRLGAVLAKHGLKKSESQTPREFARTASAKFAANAETADLALLPEMVVEAFYLVRFGRLPLDKDKREEVEHALARLDKATAG